MKGGGPTAHACLRDGPRKEDFELCERGNSSFDQRKSTEKRSLVRW